MQIHIKQIELENLDDVMDVEISSYGVHHWARSSFVSEMNNDIAFYFCATVDKKTIGYIGMWQIFEEAHITTLAVSPDFRSKKIAQALLIKAIDDCRDKMIKYLTLEVRVSNTPAKKLYEKFGMKSLGIRKGYYQDNNEDALIMWSENIFHEKFMALYNKNKQELSSLDIIYE